MNAVYLGAAGLAGPTGLTWLASCAAMRAGISQRRISAFRDDQQRPIIASHLAEHLEPSASTTERWLFLLAQALKEVLTKIGRAVFQQQTLILALPDAVHIARHTASSIADALSSQLGLPVDGRRVRLVHEGSSGGYMALQLGREVLRSAPSCIVAAADSLLCATTLLRLSATQRLLVEGNADGVVPGEAAAATLLTTQKNGALAALRGLGFGREPSALDNDIPLRSEGLVAAARGALQEAGIGLHQVSFRLSDAPGESFFFKEQALVLSRLLRERKAEFPLWLSAETLGHTGAAAGLCGLLWAAAAWDRHYAPGPLAIGFAGNDAGMRAAAILEQLA